MDIHDTSNIGLTFLTNNKTDYQPPRTPTT